MPKGTSWTENELSLLEENYNKVNINQLIRLLPNRTEAAIVNKAKKLKLSTTQKLKWTEEEEVKLKELFPCNTIDELLTHFSNRTSNSILAKAKEMNLKKDESHIQKVRRKRSTNWTESEDAILRKHYPTGGYKPVNEQLPHRNAKSILSRAVKLGIKRIDKYGWNWNREVVSIEDIGHRRTVVIKFTKPEIEIGE
ncbi:hypothetical protein BAOM_2928 [Peribacillus asahii]|uniref:Myb-like domain-containing protein n=1 Tax=Peribacillus asahii TaxID=228899 RepID=A0A3T0KT07_9BACI|nr:hypothetical protein [Peribacillus asahii]AZV43537.1 hypothetical protein BAOM_2928 [Peribacillus asahii]